DADIAACDVGAEWQRQPGLEQPPLAEVEELDEPEVRERELTLVDEKPGVCALRGDLVGDLLERKLAERKIAEHQSKNEKCRRQRSRDDDLGRPELVQRH